ncbi:MAG: LysM peptidoglycan-binding domain-containing protein [Anaerolineae bacterium]
MFKKLGSRPLIVALAVAFVLALGLASVGFAAPADSPSNWGCDACCSGYVVHPGDMLSGIAWRFGVPVHALASYNGIWNPNYIRIGQCIKIPPYGGHYYDGHPGQNWCNSCGWGGSWGYDKGNWGWCNTGCGWEPKPAPRPMPRPLPYKK